MVELAKIEDEDEDEDVCKTIVVSRLHKAHYGWVLMFRRLIGFLVNKK